MFFLNIFNRQVFSFLSHTCRMLRPLRHVSFLHTSQKMARYANHKALDYVIFSSLYMLNIYSIAKHVFLYEIHVSGNWLCGETLHKTSL